MILVSTIKKLERQLIIDSELFPETYVSSAWNLTIARPRKVECANDRITLIYQILPFFLRKRDSSAKILCSRMIQNTKKKKQPEKFPTTNLQNPSIYVAFLFGHKLKFWRWDWGEQVYSSRQWCTLAEVAKTEPSSFLEVLTCRWLYCQLDEKQW